MNYEDTVRELFFWQKGTAGSFQSALFELFQKADSKNKALLALGFPYHYKALLDWNTAGDYGNDLFRQHGLIKGGE